MSVPEKIKIVDKNKAVGSAGSLEPGVEVEEPAETLCSEAESGKRTTEENSLT